MELKHDLTEDEISDFFMSDPKLAYAALPDDALVYMYNNKKYKALKNSCYFGVMEGNNLIALMQWELFTPTTITCHFYIKSNLHGTGLSVYLTKELRKYFKETSSFKKVICPSPAPCVHVTKHLLKCGFELEAVLKKSMPWRKEIVDLNLFSLEL